jgi:acyl-CoA thioesterase I
MISRMMSVVRWLLACVVLAAAGCAQNESASVAEAQPSASAPRTSAPAVSPAGRPRIVILGDSLTAGLGLNQGDSYPSLLQVRLEKEGYDYEIVNAGVSGDTSAGGLRRLDWALEGNVRVLVMELGANDGLRGLPVEAMKSNLSEIIVRAQKRAVTVILTGMEAPPNYGPAYTSAFRQAYRDLAAEHGVAFVPFLLEGVAGIRELNNPDGIHPNPRGARIIEGTVWRALEPVLDRPAR